MSFDGLLATKRLAPHETSPAEVDALLRRVERDLRHARLSSDSEDWRFIAAYSAALSLATIVLAASGFRARGAGHHLTTISALPFALGDEARATSEYLNECREIRNEVLYDTPGRVERAEVERLMAEVELLRERVLTWLAEQHAELLPEGDGG